MATSFGRFSRLLATACAVAITAASAWALVASSASADRDPFRFEAVITPNDGLHPAAAHGAEAHTAQVRNGLPVSQS